MFLHAIYLPVLKATAKNSEYGVAPFMFCFESAKIKSYERERIRKQSSEDISRDFCIVFVAVAYLASNEDPDETKKNLREANFHSSEDLASIIDLLIEAKVMQRDADEDFQDFEGIFEVETLERFLSEPRVINEIAVLKQARSPISRLLIWTGLISLALGLHTELFPNHRFISMVLVCLGLFTWGMERSTRVIRERKRMCRDLES